MTLGPDWTQCDCGMNLPPGKECPVCNEQGKLQKVAVVIDDYKLKHMEKALKKNNFLYEVVHGPTSRAFTLIVYIVNPKKLRRVVEKVNAKTRR